MRQGGNKSGTRSKPRRRRRPAIFLDRDGVINYERDDYVKSWSEFRFVEGALEGIRELSVLGLPIIIVTNQSAVGRGLISEIELRRIHSRMAEEIRRGGGKVSAIYYCPHKPGDGCSCRKPSPGLFLKAKKRFRLDMQRSWLIGDKATDTQAAENAGCMMIRMPTNQAGSLRTAAGQVAGALERTRQ